MDWIQIIMAPEITELVKSRSTPTHIENPHHRCENSTCRTIRYPEKFNYPISPTNGRMHGNWNLQGW
jgi:hypothetical protein